MANGVDLQSSMWKGKLVGTIKKKWEHTVLNTVYFWYFLVFLLVFIISDISNLERNIIENPFTNYKVFLKLTKPFERVVNLITHPP